MRKAIKAFTTALATKLPIRLTIILGLFFLSLGTAIAQQKENSDKQIVGKRIKPVFAAHGVLFSGSMAGLYGLWYKDYPQSSFHFNNDWNDWLYMDKAGHMLSAYYIQRFSYGSYKWAHLDERESLLYSGILAASYMTCIEIFDGFSKEWGASTGDFTANILGISLFSLQQKLWGTQRISLKWSFHQSQYAKYRPDVFHRIWYKSMLKDYNGQTYWICFNIASFFPERNIPEFLELAIGYGAEGLLGGSENPEYYNDKPLPVFKRRPQLFLSAGINPAAFKIKSEFLKYLLRSISFIKIPLPTLEYDLEEGLRFHPLYF